MDLDQAVEVESPGRMARRARSRFERPHDQQDGIGADRRRLVELVGVDDEILAQDRQVAGGARGAQVIERAAEMRLDR